MKKDEALQKLLNVLHEVATESGMELSSAQLAMHKEIISKVLDELMFHVENEAFNRGVLMYAHSLSSSFKARAASDDESPTSSSTSTSSYFKSVPEPESIRGTPKRIPSKVIAGKLPTILEEDEEQFSIEFQ